MPGPYSAVLNRIGGAVKEFTVAQRTIAIIGVAVLVLGGFALTAWLTKPAYTPLFTGLQASDASSIVEQLRTDGVPYELTAGGSTILVPQEVVYDQRLKAAAAGLPNSTGTGYALLDDMGVTSSEFQQNVTYKRALEGELASTIGALNGVRAASVRLAVPEKTVFADKVADPTASVFIETENGVKLTGDQVQAIVHLTSASIDGMKPEDVAVVDSAGNVLSAVGTGAAGSSDKQTADYEQRVVGSVQSMLDRVVGSGNATVAVAVDMSKESGQRVRETFTTPKDAPALNETSATEQYEGAGGGAAGVLGPDNIAVPGGAAGDGTFSSRSETKNNALNKVTETTAIPAGTLTRQTVSVALNQSAAEGVDVQALEGLISAAAGVNPERGDVVTVEVVPFNTTGSDAAAEALAADKAEAEAARQAELLRTGILAGSIALVILVALIFFAVRNRRQRREPLELDESEMLGDLRQVNDIDALPTGALPTVQISAIPDPLALPEVPAPSEMEQTRASIEAMVAQDPQMMAEYMRSLMDDRQPA